MTKKSLSVLNEYRNKLMDEILTIQRVCAHLQQDGVISSRLKDVIMAQSTNSSKVEKLLDILPTRGEDAFPKFTNILYHRGYEELAEFLFTARYGYSMLLLKD